MAEIKSEFLASSLYRNFGITEWNEKKSVLTREEMIAVLKDLKEKKNSSLVRLLSMPFPLFAKEYFRPYLEHSDRFGNFYRDSAFGFKLYLLNEQSIEIFAEMARNPEMTYGQILARMSNPVDIADRVHEMKMIAVTPFEDLGKMTSSLKSKDNYRKRYLYLTQYIDLETAKTLGLSVSSVFEKDGVVKGFDLEGKLALLNPCMRWLVIYFLGLYGEKRCGLKEIKARVFGREFDSTVLVNALKFIANSFDKTLEEFKSIIGYVGSVDPMTGMKEYDCASYKRMDINLQALFMMNRISEREQRVLESLSHRYKILYLTSKYMYKTKDVLARNVNISTDVLEELLKKMK